MSFKSTATLLALSAVVLSGVPALAARTADRPTSAFPTGMKLQPVVGPYSEPALEKSLMRSFAGHKKRLTTTGLPT